MVQVTIVKVFPSKLQKVGRNILQQFNINIPDTDEQECAPEWKSES